MNKFGIGQPVKRFEDRRLLSGEGRFINDVNQTVPIFWPIIAGLDFGMEPDDLKLWFGVITLIVVEVGLITPPVGLNVFVINSIARDVPMIETFKGVIPFFLSDGIRVALIIAVPTITLVLPHLLEV